MGIVKYNHDFIFSRSIFENELKRLIYLNRFLSDTASTKGRVLKKISSVQGAIDKMENKKVGKNVDFEYAITIIRQNLNWLRVQQEVVPASKKVIAEIEEITKLLKGDVEN